MYYMQYTHLDCILHVIYSIGGWCAAQATQYSLASFFTSGLTSNLASFPANKKQLAHSHTPSSSPSPPQTSSPSPNSQATAGLLQHTSWKRGGQWLGVGRRERESQYLAFLLPHSLEIYILLLPYQLYQVLFWGWGGSDRSHTK